MEALTNSLIIFGIVLVVGFIIAIIRKIRSGKKLSVVIILTILFSSISAGMAGYLYGSIKFTIDEQNLIQQRETAVIQRLKLIREAEIVYQEVNGRYTQNWDSLINFIKNGSYPIIQRTEHITSLSYGRDSIFIEIDTIGIVSAWERIFKATYAENAADSGTFMGFKAAVGDKAIQGMPAYTIKNNRLNKLINHNFKNSGTITDLADIKEGDKISKGQLLISYWEHKFNPNVNIDDLSYVPGYEGADRIQFEIFAGRVPVGKAQLMLDVIEVKNPRPFDKSRSEDSEAKNRRPLRFGSKTDINTSGNWGE